MRSSSERRRTSGSPVSASQTATISSPAPRRPAAAPRSAVARAPRSRMAMKAAAAAATAARTSAGSASVNAGPCSPVRGSIEWNVRPMRHHGTATPRPAASSASWAASHASWRTAIATTAPPSRIPSCSSIIATLVPITPRARPSRPRRRSTSTRTSSACRTAAPGARPRPRRRPATLPAAPVVEAQDAALRRRKQHGRGAAPLISRLPSSALELPTVSERLTLNGASLRAPLTGVINSVTRPRRSHAQGRWDGPAHAGWCAPSE